MSFGGLAAVDFRRPGDAFLSCLCGSEPTYTQNYGGLCFLSCLSGSELVGFWHALDYFFLSCLSGSEQP